jgi:hypothetical protein
MPIPSSTAMATAPAVAPAEDQRCQPALRRRFPYPFRAMLAICSDLDQTPDRHIYGELMRFLNTTAPTGMGRGVGLEVANSIYFDMPAGQFSYWNTDERGRAMVRSLVQSGHIDCLHSYGDLAAHRRHAGRALDELVRHDCRLEVWVDHAQAPSNFGSDIMRGSGDVPDSPVYHADLTYAYGIRYVWRGRVTSVVGQGVPARARTAYDPRHPAASLRTVSKEAAKGLLARRGSAKYRMHADNTLTAGTRLRDGHAVVEFLRANPSWRGVDRSATASGIGDVLTPRVLDTLVRREGACVLYTHLGKIASRDEPLPAGSRAALARLAELERRGLLLVTTTARLLKYWTMRDAAAVTVVANGETEDVHVQTPSRRESLAPLPFDGLSVYVRESGRARVFVDGRERLDIVRNPADHTGRESVSLPWPRLELPPL